MGHERIGSLPKSRRWREIVRQIGDADSSEAAVAAIVRQTTDNVRDRFDGIQRDGGVNAAFEFLVILAVTSRATDPQDELSKIGIRLPDSPTPLSFAKASNTWITSRIESPEYAALAQKAVVDAIATWTQQNQTTQAKLFETVENPYDTWQRAGSGTGFCELSRLFFAKFTERYLNYFLEREASAVIPDIQKRDAFQRQVGQHVEEVSQHAFETAKITQSFAAGWFNKNATQHMPSSQSIEGFLSIAFGKVREELRREGER